MGSRCGPIQRPGMRTSLVVRVVSPTWQPRGGTCPSALSQDPTTSSKARESGLRGGSGFTFHSWPSAHNPRLTAFLSSCSGAFIFKPFTY